VLKYNHMSDIKPDPITEPKPKPEPNPVTRRKHRHEVLWQITVPMVIGVVIVLILAVLATMATDYMVSKGADMSTIWLIAPMLIVLVLIFIITAASIYGLVRIIQVLPVYSRQVLDFLIEVGLQVRMASNKAVEPFIRAQSFQASVRGFVRSLRRK
jgi:sterol desaturase/sphingolipid hydroxylase (fatty acid hydroxylase superfamily)